MKDGPSYVVLLFHSVDDRSMSSLKGLGNISPESFTEVCAALTQEFDIVDLRRLVDLMSKGEETQGRFLSVTFDDGPKSYALNAVPIMESLGVPSTCFLITDCIGDKTVFWRYLYNYCINAGFGKELSSLVNAEYGALMEEKEVISFTRGNYSREKTKRVMDGIFRHIVSEEEYRTRENELFLSYDDIEKLKKDPLVTFGIHTRTHPVMKGLSDEQLRDEISGSAAFYRSRIGEGFPMFSVPFGRLYRDYDERTIFSALDLSIGIVFSAYGGTNKMGQPLYNIRRIHVHEGLLESGAERFVRSVSDAEVFPEYQEAEERLRDAIEHRIRG